MKGIAGFTLLELVIVIIVLGILVAVGLPVYTTVIEKARAKVAIEQIGEIQQSIAQWAMTRATISTYVGLSMQSIGYPADPWVPVTGSLWNYTITNSSDGGNTTRPVIVAAKILAPYASNYIRYQVGARDTTNGNWPQSGNWGTTVVTSTHPGQP